ncbi:MAG: hypothetical protein ACLFN8_02070 [Candidatus Woesearchaeota archaeon]
MKFVSDYSGKVVDEKKALTLIKYISEDLLKFYESDYSSLLVPNDKEILKNVSRVLKSRKSYDYMVVVGIGGSNLGALAVLDAVCGKHFNSLGKKKVFFADTVDSDNLSSILKMLEGEKFLLVLISKSGTTTESVANFNVLLKKIPVSERKERVIAITDKGSALDKYALLNGFDVLFIPKKVGGRYSVFTAVGLLPLMFAGVGVSKLLRGANAAIESFDKNNFAFRGALDLYGAILSGKSIVDLFLFSNDLESLGKWYRQLVGESLGKKLSLDKKVVFTGITPTVSIGSTDLHSVGQLYLGGPRDKFTSFVSLNKTARVVVPKLKSSILESLENLTFAEIMDAILEGTMLAYKKNKLPFNHYVLEDKSAFEVGFFMQTKMLEVMILAHLMNVNPFDQPSVEDYKIETRKLLAKK